MKTNHNIDQLVNQTLDSTEGIQKASPGPYFFTRVQARLNKTGTDVWDIMLSYLSRPSIVVAGIILIIMIDVVAFTNLVPNENSTAEQAEVVAEEYNMAMATIYEYDKPR